MWTARRRLQKSPHPPAPTEQAVRLSAPSEPIDTRCFQSKPGPSIWENDRSYAGESIAGRERKEPMEALAVAGADALLNSRARTGFMLGDVASFSDEELLKYCAEGEPAALRELVRRHQAPLYRFLYRLMGSEEDAEEAVSDVFV